MADPNAPTPPGGIPVAPWYAQVWFRRLVTNMLGGVFLALSMAVPNPLAKVVLRAVGEGITQAGDFIPSPAPAPPASEPVVPPLGLSRCVDGGWANLYDGGRVGCL